MVKFWSRSRCLRTIYDPGHRITVHHISGDRIFYPVNACQPWKTMGVSFFPAAQSITSSLRRIFLIVSIPRDTY